MRPFLAFLLLLLVGSALGQRGTSTSAPAPAPEFDAAQIARIEEAVRSAPSPQAAAAAIPPELFNSSGLQSDLRSMRRGQEASRRRALEVLGALRLAAAAEADASALAKIRAIKSRPEYRTAQPGTASNWFAKTLEGFGRWFNDSLRRLFGRGPNVNAPDMPNISLPGWLIYVVWVLLAGIVLAAAWPLIRLIRFRIARRQRKAKGILEEEPERTRSEYLNLAEELAAEGDFRGAIRMSYLAALKRFDEARVARFDRGETNWEHLARIRSSPTLPTGLDFRPATAAFDHYWYGKRPAHREDYELFVRWYDEVDTALRRAVAA